MSKRPKMTAHHDQSLRAMDLTEDTTELYEELYQGPDDANYQHDPKEEKNALAPFMINLFGRSVNYVVLAVHANIVLYSVFFWIQQGTMPYLIKKFEVDPAVFGYLQTTFAIVQLCGGPLFGRYGDLYGGQAALVLAFSSAALSYLILGMSFTVPMLFLSRLPSVFMHAMQGGQMVVTDMSEEKQRSDALGKLGLSYGIGFIVGPLVGGVLTKAFGEQFAAFVAASGSILSIVIVKMSIPKHTKLYHTEVHKEGKEDF
ncbi:solute carrier family 22 member 18-like [Lingula anatina]|uniref:Solute carrier family 22 member 18-like n=1 Tax=Lingula anatina TaxID=7574 RepID=A0A1S3IND0_LINAN|nr:solute carrier family 22 member 18-like [Lingula anatina]|eukprot:XP_013399044.1 solute carrier family 22 member 18-like [Lingula anatina]